MESLEFEIERILQDKIKAESLRTLKQTDPSLADFASNDYLGLSRSPELQLKIHQELLERKLPLGATGSRLLTGNSLYAEELESKLRSIFKAESCLLFNSGYAANVGVLSSLPKKGDTIIYDELSHASIKDGIRLSLAKRYPFRHNDIDDLERKLKIAHGRTYVVVESLYSMDGDECKLHDLITLKNKFDFEIVIDEAHSTGVAGSLGEGLSVTSQLQEEITVRIYTFGKALGSHGACVAVSNNLKQFLVNYSRPFIYSTALPPHTLISISQGFEFIKSHPELAQDLRLNIRRYLERTTAKIRSYSRSAIQTIVIPGNAACKEAARKLQQKGFDVRPILSPTVAKGAERLRICLHAFNTEHQIEGLANELISLVE